MRVSDYMSEKVVTANLRDGLHQTFMRMVERGIHHMPVLDGEKIVGVISDRDLRRPDFIDSNPDMVDAFVLDDRIKVERAMSGNPKVVKANDNVLIALDLFIERHYGALPVIDDNGKLVGMLSAFDLLRALKKRLPAE
jgi:acetoin utilization protein AcuB